jgi:hypothetical protein
VTFGEEYVDGLDDLRKTSEVAYIHEVKKLTGKD